MNTRVLSRGLVAACTLTLLASGAFAQDNVPAHPINLIINKAPRGSNTRPDPDPVVIGECGDYMIFSAKISATVRKIFIKAVFKKDRDGIERWLRPEEIDAKKYPLKASRVLKGEVDNYVYEDDPVETTQGAGFFHEKGNGLYRIQATTKGAAVMFVKKTDTDKTGADSEKMATGLSLLDWAGKFPGGTSKTNFYPYLLFAAPDAKKGKELWISDGTAKGTKVLFDITTTTHPETNSRGKTIQVPDGSDIGPISSYFPDLAESYGGQSYFSAKTADGTAYDVYRVDSFPDAPKGQPKFTLTSICLRKFGFGVNKPTGLAATPSGIFFGLPYQGGGLELWGYDPINKDDLSQEVLTFFGDNTGSIQPTDFEFRSGFRFGNKDGYLFSGIDGSNGREPLLAHFSGVTPITTSLGNFAAAGASSNPRLFTTAGDTLFFVANPGGGEHLYRTDGNPSGFEDCGPVANIRDITPVVDWFGGGGGTETGSRVYYVADDNTGTPVLWYVQTLRDNAPSTQVKVLTPSGFPVKNPTSMRRLIGNGVWYLFFACDGAGTEFETITPTKGDPFPAQHQVWYTGEFFDNQ